MIILTVSVWSEGGSEVPPESPMRRAASASSSVTLTPHLFRFALCFFVSCLSFVIFSAPVFVLCCVVSCFILYFSDLFFFLLYSALSLTALYGSVVLSSIKQEERVALLTTHSLYMTAPEAFSQQRIL